jgi:hypothetical protein
MAFIAAPYIERMELGLEKGFKPSRLEVVLTRHMEPSDLDELRTLGLWCAEREIAMSLVIDVSRGEAAQ